MPLGGHTSTSSSHHHEIGVPAWLRHCNHNSSDHAIPADLTRNVGVQDVGSPHSLGDVIRTSTKRPPPRTFRLMIHNM
jgi:hypothetical protein